MPPTLHSGPRTKPVKRLRARRPRRTRRCRRHKLRRRAATRRISAWIACSTSCSASKSKSGTTKTEQIETARRSHVPHRRSRKESPTANRRLFFYWAQAFDRSEESYAGRDEERRGTLAERRTSKRPRPKRDVG